jgi:hypothetical protein
MSLKFLYGHNCRIGVKRYERKRRTKKGDTIAVWVSCGAASAAAAILAKRIYGEEFNLRFVNNPIAEEHPDNNRFLNDLSEFMDCEIEYAINPEYPSCSIFDVFDKRKFMSSPYGAPCTVALKKRARQIWQNKNKPDWHIFGFTLDEKKRHDMFVLSEIDNVIPILIDRKMTKDDCGKMLISVGIELPAPYSLGMPNANCIGCVKATSPTYWNLIRKIDEGRFNELAKRSRDLNVRLARHKGVRVFLDELPPEAKGQSIKKMDLDCGLFCEEKWS